MGFEMLYIRVSSVGWRFLTDRPSMLLSRENFQRSMDDPWSGLGKLTCDVEEKRAKEEISRETFRHQRNLYISSENSEDSPVVEICAVGKTNHSHFEDQVLLVRRRTLLHLQPRT